MQTNIRRRQRTAAILTAALAGCGLVLAASSAAACNLNVVNITSTQWTGNHGRGYEVYDRQRGALVVTFGVQSRDGNCQFFASISPTSAPGGGSGALRGPGTSLRYDVFKDASASQALKPATLASTSEVFVGAAPAGSSVTSLQFAIIVWAEQVVPPGLYSDNLEVSLYDGQLGNGTLRDRRHVHVSAVVPAVAEISFAEGAAFDPNVNVYTVNYNLMRTGDRRVVSLKARSNAGYRIRLNSLNGSVMRNLDPGDDSAVPYTLKVDGAQVVLPRGGYTQAILNSSLTPATGRQHMLEFQIGDISGVSAGDYQDIINLSVDALR